MIHIFRTNSVIKVFINDKEIKDTVVGKDGTVYVEDPRDVSFDEILGIKIKDIPSGLYLSLRFNNSLTNQWDFIYIDTSINEKSIKIYTDHLAEKWDYKWNLKKFISKIKKVIESEKYSDLTLTEYIEGGDGFFGYTIKFPFPHNGTIGSFTSDCLEVIKSVQEDAFELLEKEIKDTGVRFNFPPHLSKACDQYLAYFGQFLSDLGVESNTELKNTGAEIIFSVTPQNKNEALHKIHQALQVFLLLPDLCDELETNILENNEQRIKTQRLLSIINHLKSQLNLANAMNYTLEDKLKQTQEIKTSSIFISSLEEAKINGKIEDKIHFFRGILEIKKFEKNGIVINFPKLVTEFKKPISKT